MTSEPKLPKKVFLIIKHTQVPVPSQPGKFATQEQAIISTSPKLNLITSASFIVEILSKKIEKNRYNTLEEADAVAEYYLQQYLPKIKEYFQKFYNVEFEVE